MSTYSGTGVPEHILRYVARFDRREFWLAHEELEELWQQDRRDFLKGMIQIAAAYVHIERRNWRGAARLLRTGLQYIADAPASCDGFDVDAVRSRVEAARDRVVALAEGNGGEPGEGLFFSLGPLFSEEIPEGLVEDEPLPYRVRRYSEGYRPVRRDPAG